MCSTYAGTTLQQRESTGPGTHNMAKKKSASSNQWNDGSWAIEDLSKVRLYLKTIGSGLQLSEIRTWWRSKTAYRKERVPSQTGDIKLALAVLFTCYRLWSDSQRGQTADFVFDEFLEVWKRAKTQKGTVWYHAVFRQLLSETFFEIHRRTEERKKKKWRAQRRRSDHLCSTIAIGHQNRVRSRHHGPSRNPE